MMQLFVTTIQLSTPQSTLTMTATFA